MTLWLIIILGLVLLWLALGSRTGDRARQLRDGVLKRTPLAPSKTPSPESLRLLLNDAVRARGEASGSDSPPESKEFSMWLNSLSERELKTFARQLDAMTRQSKVNPSWAMEGYTTGQVHRELQDVLVFNALAIWRARALEPLVRLEEYRANPYARGNRALAQKVFAQLAASDAITVSPGMMLAPENERSRYVHQVIENAWIEDPAHVIATVRQVMHGPAAPAPAAPVEPTPLPANEFPRSPSTTAIQG